MALAKIFRLINISRYGAVFLVLAVVAVSHGDHAAKKSITVNPDADWATRHMAEEHHISDFDPSSFFTLHDYDANGVWDIQEIQTTYGLLDETAKDVPQEKKDSVAAEVLKLIDTDNNGLIKKEEWIAYCEKGQSLPDFGLGPGHHGDDEYEYEIHHWEKYHDENTKEEDLIHPEDIAHFKKHDEMEQEEARIAVLDKMPIVEANIPQKFRREENEL